jgi:hypothetical protein
MVLIAIPFVPYLIHQFPYQEQTQPPDPAIGCGGPDIRFRGSQGIERPAFVPDVNGYPTLPFFNIYFDASPWQVLIGVMHNVGCDLLNGQAKVHHGLAVKPRQLHLSLDVPADPGDGL